jgi:hypothetical protein
MPDRSGRTLHKFMRIAIPLLVVFAFVWALQLGKAPRNLMARRDCENRYAQARSAAETLAVDRQAPVIQPGSRDTVQATCGSIRHPEVR